MPHRRTTVVLKVNAGVGEGGNVVVSPVAVNFALAALCAAAEGGTRDQLREVLRHRLLGSPPKTQLRRMSTRIH